MFLTIPFANGRYYLPIILSPVSTWDPFYVSPLFFFGVKSCKYPALKLAVFLTSPKARKHGLFTWVPPRQLEGNCRVFSLFSLGRPLLVYAHSSVKIWEKHDLGMHQNWLFWFIPCDFIRNWNKNQLCFLQSTFWNLSVVVPFCNVIL